MDRTSWFVVIGCVAALMFYQPIMHHFYPPAPVSQTSAAIHRAPRQDVASANSQKEETVLRTSEDEIKVEENLGEEKLAVLTNEWISAEFTNHGGGIKRIILKKHKAQGNERVILNNGGKYPMLNLDGWDGDLTLVKYEIAQQDEGSVTLVRTLGAGLKLFRKYTLLENYSIKLEQRLENTGTQAAQMPAYWMQVGLGAPIYLDEDSSTRRYMTGAWFTTGEKYKSHPVTEFDGGGFLFWKSQGKLFISSDATNRLYWVCAKTQFFTINLASLSEPALKADLRKIKLSDLKSGEGKVPDAIQSKMEMPGFEVSSGSMVTKEFLLYAGPKQDGLLSKLPLNQARVMEFGWLGWISRPMLAVMNFIQHYVKNYGIAIILLTILIKIVLWIPQTKANRSMRKTQLLSPKLKELQEKHKDNPQKLQEEMMKLYRDYDVNPLGGCLPMLAQMPIFIGFYYMLLSAVELRHATFLWITDLSQPDTVARLPIPGFGIPINPMPLLMGATMFWSMNVTPQPKGVDNPSANALKIMPLVILLICYNFSSALSLYWTVQNLLSIVQMYYNLHQPMPKLEKVKQLAVKKQGGWLAMLQSAREQQVKAAKKKQRK